MNDQRVLDVLVVGRALIERPESWCAGTDRVTAYFGASMTLARCAGSACGDACGDDNLAVLGHCMNELRLAIPADWRTRRPASGVVGYNDDSATTHADIIAMYDTAIGRVRARIEALDELNVRLDQQFLDLYGHPVLSS